MYANYMHAFRYIGPIQYKSNTFLVYIQYPCIIPFRHIFNIHVIPFRYIFNIYVIPFRYIFNIYVIRVYYVCPCMYMYVYIACMYCWWYNMRLIRFYKHSVTYNYNDATYICLRYFVCVYMYVCLCISYKVYMYIMCMHKHIVST